MGYYVAHIVSRIGSKPSIGEAGIETGCMDRFILFIAGPVLVGSWMPMAVLCPTGMGFQLCK